MSENESASKEPAPPNGLPIRLLLLNFVLSTKITDWLMLAATVAAAIAAYESVQAVNIQTKSAAIAATEAVKAVNIQTEAAAVAAAEEVKAVNIQTKAAAVAAAEGVKAVNIQTKAAFTSQLFAQQVQQESAMKIADSRLASHFLDDIRELTRTFAELNSDAQPMSSQVYKSHIVNSEQKLSDDIGEFEAVNSQFRVILPRKMGVLSEEITHQGRIVTKMVSDDELNCGFILDIHKDCTYSYDKLSYEALLYIKIAEKDTSKIDKCALSVFQSGEYLTESTVKGCDLSKSLGAAKSEEKDLLPKG